MRTGFHRRRAVCHISQPQNHRRRLRSFQARVINSGPKRFLMQFPNLTLFVPSLFWPDTRDDRAYDGLDLPSLQAFIARSAPLADAASDETDWLCARFGAGLQNDRPVGALSLLGTGTDPGDSRWFCADPVHLDARRDRLVLAPFEPGSLSAAEAVAMVTSLNRHFSQDGVHFVAPRPESWFARVSAAAGITTTPLGRAVGRDVHPLLPRGEDRMAWHRLFNEVQMLLHSHPVNAEREGRELTPVNSVWFWGGGTLPEVETGFESAAGHSDLLKGLCLRAGIPISNPDRGVTQLSGICALVELGQAGAASRYGNLMAWQKAMRELESTWFAPLVRHLSGGALPRMTVATVAEGRGWEWTAERSDLWKFWRRAHPLGDTALRLFAAE